jgi:hypothetical protein
MKILLLTVLLLISITALAESSSLNLNLPATPGSYASDRIRADNVECSMAIGASTNLEFGVVGLLNQNGPYNSNLNMPNEYDPEGLVKDIGVYAKIIVPLNPPKSRLDCNELYKLQLEVKRMEVQKLKQEIANLRKLKFEGDE